MSRAQPAGGQVDPPGNHRSESTRLLDADALSERWSVPRSHVYRLAREGSLPTVKLGRYRRWRLPDVEAFERNGGTDG